MTAIELHHGNGAASGVAVWQDLTNDQVDLIKRTIAKDATDDELALFVTQANKKRLDPFSNQIWFTKRQGKVSILTGIDGYRLIADRTGRHAGTDTWWCGQDGEWREVWLDQKPPAAAKVTVQKVTDQGTTASFTGIALWSEYGEKADGFMFKKMPAAQLAKCAEALALRKAFPSETSGVYTAEEMAQADGDTAPPTRASLPPAQTQRTPVGNADTGTGEVIDAGSSESKGSTTRRRPPPNNPAGSPFARLIMDMARKVGLSETELTELVAANGHEGPLQEIGEGPANAVVAALRNAQAANGEQQTIPDVPDNPVDPKLGF